MTATELRERTHAETARILALIDSTLEETERKESK